MGFWHTGYLDMHGLGPPGTIPLARDIEWTPTYRCSTCDAEFDTPEVLRSHEFRGHLVPIPALYFRGVECQRSEAVVADEAQADDWVIPEASGATVNGQPVGPSEVGATLARMHQGVADVQLELEGVIRDYRFRFAVANEADLDGVDNLLLELARAGRLDRTSIDWFIERGRRFPSASRYLDGIAKYLFGALARDDSSDSGLEIDEYRDRYSQAVEQLASFDRTPARIIRGLVAFHFNHFSEVRSDVGSSRLHRAASRLRQCLEGSEPARGRLDRDDATELDLLLSDADTERMLRWVALPIGSAPDDVLSDMDHFQRHCDPLDRLKLQLILAEHDLAEERLDSARRRAHALRHAPNAADWAQSVLRRATGTNHV